MKKFNFLYFIAALFFILSTCELDTGLCGAQVNKQGFEIIDLPATKNAFPDEYFDLQDPIKPINKKGRVEGKKEFIEQVDVKDGLIKELKDKEAFREQVRYIKKQGGPKPDEEEVPRKKIEFIEVLSSQIKAEDDYRKQIEYLQERNAKIAKEGEFNQNVEIKEDHYLNADTESDSDNSLDQEEKEALNEPPSPILQDYRKFPIINSRVAVWFVGQLHLMFAAFILGVPIFAVTMEYIGLRSREPRYDRMAKELTKLTLAAFSTTAILGALLIFLFIGYYPTFFNYMSGVFHGSFWIYALLFFGETFTLYIYWYSWDKFNDNKIFHIIIGILLNLFGIAIMFIANSWVSFMISPAGIDDGNLLGLWQAITNFTWMPLNIHRFIANICFGGAVAAACAAFKFMLAKTEAEKAYYDWMGYIGNCIAVSAFLVLPFAGYWLTREIYAYNQQLGISLMGGFLSWLWIIQAVLIGILFMCTNYYLWVGMERIPGSERYRGYTKYLLGVLTLCFMVWATPHTLVASFIEVQKMGGSHHPLVGFLGVMSAKNTAVNLMILATFISFIIYRRCNKVSTVNWAAIGNYAQIGIITLSAGTVIFYGIYGYMVEAFVRVGFSIYQVGSVIIAIISITVIDILLYRKAQTIGRIKWGQVPVRSQYVLLLVAVTFTWLMGLMGFARSAMRQHWHIYGVLRDNSPEAYTPALGYAANVVSVITIVFVLMLLFIFWLGSLGDKKKSIPQNEQDNQTIKQKNNFVTIVKGIGFAVALIGLFNLYSNSIPQLESKVPKDIVIPTDGLTVESIVKMGETLFTGKGNCQVCHKEDVDARAPILNQIGSIAETRNPDLSSKEYLMESLVKPTAFIVKGYGPIMPPVDKPPISLSEAEIMAVIAYLQSLGGAVTITPEDLSSTTTNDADDKQDETQQSDSGSTEITMMAGNVEKGKIVFHNVGCSNCHEIKGGKEKYGPNLLTIGIRASAEYIRESILEPHAKINEGYKFKMPYFTDKLSVEEFNDLMAFMLSLKG